MDSPSLINNKMENYPKDELEEEANSKFKKLTETLPKEKRWDTSSDLYQYQGFWYPFSVLQGAIHVQENFKSSPNDIYICSAPKAGVTWLKSLCYAIETRDRYDLENNNPLLTNLAHRLLPLLETEIAQNLSNRNPQVPFISTHMPYNALPKSINFLDGTKIIYICREPKDTFTSLWHFMRYWTWMQNGDRGFVTCLEKEFELFCEGKTVWGPYWDHVLEYWKESLDKPDSILFLKYEELKKDTLFYVRKLADFMGKPFSKDEEKDGVPQRIVNLCSFENLSNLKENKSGKHQPYEIENSAYFRKGEAGDWKNLLTLDMTEKMDRITKEKLKESSLIFGESTATPNNTKL